MSGPNDTAAAPVAVQRFVKQLVITHKAVALYPPASSIPRESATDAVAYLDAVLAEQSEMRMAATKDGLFSDGVALFPAQSAFVAFAQELYNRSISEVRFHAGVDAESLVAFLGVVRISAEELMGSGGAASRLWDSGVDAITVIEASTMIIDEGDLPGTEAQEAEGWPPDHVSIDALLAAARGGPPRDRRLLVRVVLDSEVTAAYLAAAFGRSGSTAEEGARGIPIASLAHAADTLAGDQRAEALQSLADAVTLLEPEQRRALVSSSLLPTARTDDSVAALVRQIGVDGVCRALVEGLDETDVSSDALARALRNLAMISMAGRDEVLDAAGAAMRSAGFEESVVGSVLEAVLPTRLVERPHASDDAEGAQPADSILQLISVAPGVSGQGSEDDELRALLDEARSGVTDGDVMGALVTLATLDSAPQGFTRAMDDLEDGLELLIDRGEFGVAADAAESLLRAAESAPPEKRARFVEAIGRLAGAREMRSVHQALRLYRKGTSEHSDCVRLLGTLGTLAIDPLLEVLADEPDMAVRKSLVQLISTIADRHVSEVGERVSDSRWYVVRNVVSILGTTKRREILPYLGRALRHADARVRRETIRALTGVQDAQVIPMLVVALDDPDAQNVQLAARYLGRLEVAEAVAPLERVASGEGRGNRDAGPRIEAIEALGTIGSASALPTLRGLAGRRRRIGAGKGRGIVTAAQSAVDAIVARGEGAR